MAVPVDTIRTEATQWIDQTVARQADYHPKLVNEMFI